MWRAEDLAELRGKLVNMMPDFRDVLLKEPVFCFDAAAKLCMWSDLVYSVEDHMNADDYGCLLDPSLL